MRSAAALPRKKPHPLRRRRGASASRDRARCYFPFLARRARKPWTSRRNDQALVRKRPADFTSDCSSAIIRRASAADCPIGLLGTATPYLAELAPRQRPHDRSLRTSEL